MKSQILLVAIFSAAILSCSLRSAAQTKVDLKDAQGKNVGAAQIERRFRALEESPDARALIKLGLGPSHDHLLNPESAMTTGPDMPKAASLSPVSHSPDPAAAVGRPSSASPTPASNAAHDSPSPQ